MIPTHFWTASFPWGLIPSGAAVYWSRISPWPWSTGSLSIGRHGTVLVPANESLARMYEKMGYALATTATEFSCQAAPTPVAMTEISLVEFQRRRSAMLPYGSLQPDDAGLAFLETQASFYAGDDFLLTGREEDGIFFGMELLGNSAAAPGILQALGHSFGTFRCPGKDVPFAMYRPLDPQVPPPAYFAFAFD